jgi:hypothetical protein
MNVKLNLLFVDRARDDFQIRKKIDLGRLVGKSQGNTKEGTLRAQGALNASIAIDYFLLTNWRLERLTRQDPVVDLDLGFFRVLGTRVQRFAYTPPGALYSTPLWCSALESCFLWE